jgi:CspA family cold shock protein
MATGTVKWFNYKKGYGFVTPDEKGAKDIFVHITAVNSAGINNLQDGQKISYEVESRQGKFSAINIKLAN